MAKYLILGAGITGLSVAFHLRKDYFLAEKAEKVGGLAGSVDENGFVFDYAEHFLRIPNEQIKIFFINLMNEKIFSQELNSAIYFKDNYIPYPFQENIRELPIKELKECAKSLLLNNFSTNRKKKKFSNFKEFIYYQYGDYIAKEFMIPYNEKIWSISTDKMNTSWFLDPNFIPSFNFNQIIDAILPREIEFEEKQYIRWYPVKGGSQTFANSFIPHLSNVALNHEAIKIDLNRKFVVFNNNHIENFDYMISTIPLPELLKLIVSLPKRIKKLQSKLKYNSIYCMNLCLNSENDHKYHWLYFPQKDIPFSRLFFSNNFSKFNAPIGKGTCTALVSFLPNSNFNINEFEQKSINILIKLGFINDISEIIGKVPIMIKYGFPIPTIGIEKVVQTIQKFLKKFNIYSIGRYGEWKYAGIEHAIEDGKKIASFLG